MLRPGLFCATAVLLILGVFWSVRLARADFESAQPDAPRVAQACRLVPASAGYWLRAAALTDLERPDDPSIDAALDQALQLNPLSAEARLARAVRAEMRGKTGQAEADYLEAARIDHMYKPAWALANFYVRQQKPDEFFAWARKCLEIVEPRRLEPFSYNPAPVFDLAWRVTQNAAEIRRRLIPPRHFIQVDYLEYLGERSLTDAGAGVALDLASYADSGDNYYLLNFCERLIGMGKGASAVAIWNAMVVHSTVHAQTLDPAHNSLLTNADLHHPLERAGFDWRLPPAEGVLQNHFPDTGEVRFDFSGDQPEGVLAFYQSVPVAAGTSYQLTFRYRTSNMLHADGLSWQVWDYAGQHPLPATCQLKPSDEWTTGDARFAIPAGVSIVRLGLVYQRATGSTRVRGTIALSSFGLSPVPPKAKGSA